MTLSSVRFGVGARVAFSLSLWAGCGGGGVGGSGTTGDDPASTGLDGGPGPGTGSGDTTGAASSGDEEPGSGSSTGDDPSEGSGSSSDTSEGIGSSSDEGGSSESGDTGEAACALDPVGVASGAVQMAWSVGPDAQAADIAPDALGNVVVVGTVESADFGTGPLVAADGALFVAKYDSTGTLTWVEQLEGSTGDASVAVDSNGDVLVTGGFEDGVLAKLDGSDGAVLWVADTGQYGAQDVAVLPGGDAVVHHAANPPDSEVHRISGVDGQIVWSRYVVEPLAFGDLAGGQGLAVAGDTIIWGGFASGTIPTPAGDVVPDPELSNFTVVAMDEAGDTLWAYVAESPTAVWLTDVAADPCGGVYLYGELQGDLDAGLGEELLGFNDVFLIRLQADGTPEWGTVYPNFGYVYPQKIAADPEGSVVLTGRINDVDFGLGNMQAPEYAGFLVKVDRDGQTQWAHLFAGTYWNESMGAAFDAQGHPWVVGRHSGDVDIAGTALPDPGAIGIPTYVARFAP
jgi:hypothetical protein